ncbi:MAG: glycosyltransferase family 2 protein [Bacteroidota bacterium]
MNFYLVIPAHNEEAFLAGTLQSLAEQTILPKKIVVVNDNSTDGTQHIIDSFSSKYPFIHSVAITSAAQHAPGSKVINAFYEGLKTLDTDYDVICKFDADLIFPSNYLEKVADHFLQNKNCGMVGGFCYIKKKDYWVLENLTNKDHIRGALKAYRKACFEQIGGLKKVMGWDTVDELLAQYHHWEVITDETLHVKHLKPTGANYLLASQLKQGQAFKRMRYGFWLTLIASLKLGAKKRSFSYFWGSMRGYFSSNNEYIVSEKEGKFIRSLRWKNIRKRFL